jgi:hypothetical protein
MSRHEYTPPGWPSHCSFTIGWDDPLRSNFALMTDRSLGQGEAGNLLATGSEPPHFRELDNLLRVVNGCIRDRLPSLQLPPDLRRQLRRAADARRPVVNGLTVTDPGERAADPPPLTRPAMALGTHQDYLEGDELQEVLDGMADRFFRLERIYLARKAAGLTEHNDADTKRVRISLEHMQMVCHTLDSFLRTDTLVAVAAVEPFYELFAEAARVLQAHEAHAAGEAVH